MAEPVSESTEHTGAGAAAAEQPAATRLMSATVVMATGTGLSRVLGFVKAALVVAALGNGSRQADMFTVSNVIPQAIYLLLAGGVLNTVFVPQIVRAMKEHDDGGEAYTNRLLTLGLSAIGLIAVAATVLAPVIMGDIYLNPKWKAPELSAQYDSIILLSYLCLPQIFFYGVNVMLGQVLNARGKFGPMMWSPIANNIVGIGSIALFLIIWHGERDTGAAFTLGQILVLGLGATLGIVAQALILVPYMRSVGFRFRPRFDFRHSGLGRAGQVAKWTVGYMIVTQLALVVVTRLANGATIGGEGAGWNVYQNANLIFMLPHSLITVSLTTAMLPSTSRMVVAGDLAGARDETMRTMRLAVTALLPASIAFLALAFPISEVLFGHGKGATGWPLIAWTLMAFAVGLVPFTLQYICLRAFYALEDTRTTFFVQILIASVNVAAAIGLVMPFHRPNWVAPGLALAYALAYIVGLGVSFRRLGRKLPGLSGAEIARHCLLVLLAVLPAGLVAYLIVWAMGLWSRSFPALVLALAVAAVVAVGIYLGLARLLQISEVNQIVGTLLRRGARGRTGGGPGTATVPEQNNPFDIDSPPSGGSGMTEALESGTIDTGTAGAAPRPTEAFVAGSVADEESVVTRIRQGIDNPAGQQHMAGGQSEQAAGTAPGRSEESPAEQTAPFSLDELRAESNTAQQRPVPGPPNGPTPPRVPSGHPGAQDDPDHLPAGAVLADRYRLEELLAWTGVPHQASAMVWRAFDQVLSRSVVVHLLQPGDPRAAGLLTAGRRAAGATDSRFLRVLDAVEEGGLTADGRTVGTYIVSEYAEGQSLQSVLAAAPLTGLESAWVIREVADALSGAHARGLFHRRLVPDMVIITPAGNIKIVGLLIEAALRPEEYPERDPGADALEAIDVTDLGRLLYACLVARWPGDGVQDLPAAPAATGTAADSGHPWLTPRQVRHGVSPALDRLCDQLLSPVPRQRAPRITTAAALVGELDRVLGTADATGDLERRLRHPQPSVLEEDPEVAEYAAPEPEAEPYALIERNGSIAAGTNSSDRVAPPQTPNQPRSELADKPRSGPRVWVWVLVIVLLLAALLLTVLTARGLGPAAPLLPGNSSAKHQSKPTQSAPAPNRPLRIVGAHDFDPAHGNPPQGGNGEEHPDLVKYAYDGNRSTDWHTMSYFGDPKFGRLKKGVGLVFDLGSAKTVGQVKLQLTGNGTDLQLRVPKGDAAAVDQPDMTTLKSWRTVAQQKGAGGSATLKPDGQVRTRYVLVFLTSLPKEGANYRGGIYEAEVLS